MSGKPSPSGTKTLLEKILRRQEVEKRLRELEDQARTIAQMKNELQHLTRDIRDELRAMDCDNVGNAGFEERLAWLIANVYQQGYDRRREETAVIAAFQSPTAK